MSNSLCHCGAEATHIIMSASLPSRREWVALAGEAPQQRAAPGAPALAAKPYYCLACAAARVSERRGAHV